MSFDLTQLIPLMTRLGVFFKAGMDQYVELRAAGLEGEDAMRTTLVAFLTAQMSDWNPKIKGRLVLDEDTRVSGAQFLTGLIINLSSESDS